MTLLINGVDQESKLLDYKFSIGLNNVPQLELNITIDLHINDTVKFIVNSITLFNGFVNTTPVIDYDTGINSLLAIGNIAKLKNRVSESRRSWDNSNTNIIVPALIDNVFTIGSVDSFSPISFVDEFASPLLSITKLALACRGDTATPLKINNNIISSYDFWLDENDDKFYFKTNRGSLTSVASYNINSEVWGVKSLQEGSNTLVNYVVVTGAGDGINQIKRQASNLYCPILNALASTGDLTINLSDDDYQSYLIAKNTYLEDINGTNGIKIKINDEIMGVTASDDSNKTLSVLDSNRGMNSTSKQSHAVNDLIYGGSVLKHGLRQKIYYDRSTIDSDTAFDIAQSAIYELSTNKETLSFNIENVNDFWVGDVITLNGIEYRVLNISTSLSQGTYTVIVGYISRGQINMYEDIIMKLTDGSVYAQGATNIYSVQDADNCDPTHPLNIKFYIPPEAVRINHVKLNFTLENFRAYSTGAASGGGSSVTSSASNSHTHSVSIPSHNHSVQGNMRLFYEGDSQSGTFEPYVFSASTAPNNSTQTSWPSKDFLIWGKSDVSGEDITVGSTLFSTTNSGGGSTQTSSSGGVHTHDVNILAHTHPIAYGIYEETLSSPNVIITANGNAVGSYTTGQDNIDVSAWITSSGWHTIQFTPDQRMRINANVYIQVYIESK